MKTAASACVLFFILGLIVLPYPGVQHDEAVFMAPFYSPRSWHSAITVFGFDVPTMIMSYAGTLKSWLYLPWFAIWRPSALSIRLPMLMAGTATVWLTFLLVKHIAGMRAAVVSAILLATDVCFLFTTCFDWGPVALQHLLVIAGLLLLVKSHFRLGFLLFGLALWDKALFSWTLAGLAVANLVAFPKAVLPYLKPRCAAAALLWMTLGASPLLVYNASGSGQTFRANTKLSTEHFANKFAILRKTLNGSALLGYITDEDWTGDSPPRTTLARLSYWTHRHAGDRLFNLNEEAFLLAFMLAPFLWRSPARGWMVFILVFLAATWVQMALTVGTGAAHHAVLLWPFPLAFIAIVFTEFSARLRTFGKPVLIAAVGLLAASNLLVYNRHLVALIHNGEPGSWTDALHALPERAAKYRAREIYLIDWGMLNTLRLLSQGTLHVQDLIGALAPAEVPAGEQAGLLAAISDPAHVFIGFTEGHEQFRGVGAHLEQFAQRSGYEEQEMERVNDGHGRTEFRIFRFVRR